MGKTKKGMIYICGLLLAVLLSGPVLAGQDQQIAQKLAALEKINGKFSFVVLGDNRSGGDVYRKIVSMAMERKPDFIVNTGDMIASPGSGDDWNKFWELSKAVTVPYFLTVGNHDAHPKVPRSEKIYREQVDLPGNELYYSFSAGNSLFIVLDSYIDDQEKKITGEQYAWLEGVLANAGRKHTFVFLHHPLYTEQGKGHHSGDSLDKYPKDRDKLEAILAKSRVDAVFAGHEHFYQRKSVDGIAHIITGGGGAPLYGDEKDGAYYHYIHITVDGDRADAEVVDINGKVRDRF